MRERRWVVLWPENIDSKMSRREGRKIPRNLAVENPSLDEIERALRSLGLSYEREDDKRHPADWWRGRGRILVRDVVGSREKRRILVEVARKIREMRKI